MKAQMTEAELQQETERTGCLLKEQPKRKIRIPQDRLNSNNLVIPVCINGYFYYINRGQEIDVPESVAKILEDAGYY